MIVVTSGSKYMDIDAFACCLAYQKLLEYLGKEAVVVSYAPPNKSVLPELSLNFLPFSNYQIKEQDEFAVMDVSNPSYFEKFVDVNRIISVIDHHTGYENFWYERIGDNAKIEFIGAAATLVFEQFKMNSAINALNKEIAKMLMAAILDNTLNFFAEVTTARDYHAYSFLSEIIGEKDFASLYFSTCQKYILDDLIGAISNDVKLLHINTNITTPITTPECIGQLAVWNTKPIFERINEIVAYFSHLEKNWMFNLISLSDNKSFIIAIDSNVKLFLEKIFSNSFEGNIMVLDHSILRKEIIKMIDNYFMK